MPGGAGDDTFIFELGAAHGDVVLDFNGNGNGPGDQLLLEGFGTPASSLTTYVQLDATHWLVASGNGTLRATFTFSNAPVVDASDFSFG
jgi:hypothetical protein